MSIEAPIQKKLFCFGFGYTAHYLKALLRHDSEPWIFAGTTREYERQQALRLERIAAHIFESHRPLADPLKAMEGTTHLLLSIPPGEAGDPAYLAHARDIERLPTLQWVGYLSTTGVYGDRDGGTVTEKSELRPNSKRGSRRKLAEEQWQELCEDMNVPLQIFRLAGLYGPSRSALDSVRAGVSRRIHKKGHAFNRVHIGDVAQILAASIYKSRDSAIYNIADDYPAPSHEVIEYACELLNLPVPPLVPIESANLPPITQSFYNDNKRVDNSKVKQDLNIALKYPSYKEGLQAILKAEG